MESNFHKSVLSEELINNIDLKKDGIYVDMTMGRGGHTQLLLNHLGPEAIVIGIDQDNTAINFCKDKFQYDNRVRIVKNNFSNIQQILQDLKIKFVDGIFMDIGVSSPQLDNSERGFSYHDDGPLDMRMNQSQQLSAYNIINEYSRDKLISIFRQYGEIQKPYSVVDTIIKNREIKPISRTLELVELIKRAIPKSELTKKKHFARCYFQALRIAVNDEINVLAKTIGLAANCLNENGWLGIISFHSLEDKVVIKEFQKLSVINLPKEIPISCDKFQKFKIYNTKPITPTNEEIDNNYRSRSARLRFIIKNKINSN
ncbi:MAG: 16S rRNA (cytosine(1402)-N(4))-methyltransferase RsmH [Ureaplasma sp.]|nr:16S rRNA (cytosine(1402)-N(4))-methyltransferase RsmH [Ureaplasma sp.]